MRIKDYSYDKIKNLKNPMGNYQTVVDFVTKNFEEYKVCEGLLVYLSNEEIDFSCCIEQNIQKITFYKNGDAIFLGRDVYVVGNHDVPKIRDKELFEELKSFFLKFKLNEKLNKELLTNQTKRKTFKI